MDAQIFPWINDDVAIEIIGKMLAEQVAIFNDLLDSFENAGFNSDDDAVINDPVYINCIQRIHEFKGEINQIYKGERVVDIYQKVNQVYAPHLREKYSSAYAQF